ncbi:uncharacterized [Tachysurus ichikawai]
MTPSGVNSTAGQVVLCLSWNLGLEHRTEFAQEPSRRFKKPSVRKFKVLNPELPLPNKTYSMELIFSPLPSFLNQHPYETRTKDEQIRAEQSEQSSQNRAARTEQSEQSSQNRDVRTESGKKTTAALSLSQGTL